MLKQKMITITEEHEKWIERNEINLSKFVRHRLDERIGMGK